MRDVLENRVLLGLAEHVRRCPARHLRDLLHVHRHRPGRVQYPGIVILEPERHHVVHAVALAMHDGAVDPLVSELPQELVGDQIEPVAVVPVGLEQLLEGGPVVEIEVRVRLGLVVLVRLELRPGVDPPREFA